MFSDKKPGKKLIGRVETASFPELGIKDVYARIDTGAKTSAISVSHAEVENGKLAVIFFSKKDPQYSGIKHFFRDFSSGMVASSNGQAELRYKIRILISIGGKRIRARFTLADRSMQTYSTLVGRNILRGKFIVDVNLGKPLKAEEQRRSDELQKQLKRDSL